MRVLPIAIAAAVLLAAGAATAAAPASVAGTWDIDTVTVGRTIKIECKLTQTGAALGGICGLAGATGDGLSPIADTVDGSSAKWNYEAKLGTNTLKIAFDGQVSSPTAMSGTMDNTGNKSAFTAAKRP